MILEKSWGKGSLVLCHHGIAYLKVSCQVVLTGNAHQTVIGFVEIDRQLTLVLTRPSQVIVFVHSQTEACKKRQLTL